MLNKVILMGRLTSDPRLAQTNGGISVASFNIACDRDRGEETDFFPVVAGRGAADWAAQWLHKGKLVAIEGRLVNHSYTAKDGTERRETEISAERLFFTGDRRNDG